MLLDTIELTSVQPLVLLSKRASKQGIKMVNIIMIMLLSSFITHLLLFLKVITENSSHTVVVV